jgi:hypothetical protein
LIESPSYFNHLRKIKIKLGWKYAPGFRGTPDLIAMASIRKVIARKNKYVPLKQENGQD